MDVFVLTYFVYTLSGDVKYSLVLEEFSTGFPWTKKVFVFIMKSNSRTNC